jgi:hypothetical protein
MQTQYTLREFLELDYIIRTCTCGRESWNFNLDDISLVKGAWLNDSQKLESQLPSPGFPNFWESNPQKNIFIPWLVQELILQNQPGFGGWWNKRLPQKGPNPPGCSDYTPMAERNPLGCWDSALSSQSDLPRLSRVYTLYGWEFTQLWRGWGCTPQRPR